MSSILHLPGGKCNAQKKRSRLRLRSLVIFFRLFLFHRQLMKLSLTVKHSLPLLYGYPHHVIPGGIGNAVCIIVHGEIEIIGALREVFPRTQEKA